MVTASAGRRHLPLRARLELAGGQDGENGPSVRERPEIDTDSLAGWRRVGGVRVVRCLDLVDDVDPGRRHLIAAAFLRTVPRRAPLAPDVALVDVVVVGNRDAGPIAQELSPGPTV